MSALLKANTLAFTLFVCVLPVSSIAHKLTTGDNASVASSYKNIVVLDATDALPGNAVKINGLELGGKNDVESYRSLIASAKLLAANSNANIIKITKNTNDKRLSYSGRDVTINFYKAENAKHFEKEFSWSEDRMLTWDDFRGPDQPQMGHDVAAATFCGIGFETNTISSLKPDLKIYVYNTFYPTKSWVKDGLELPEILAHEQCHFDICELYTRKLRAKMSNVKVSVTDLRSKLQGIYKEVQQEYINRQELYEEETEHGIIADEQARWQQTIAAELKATNQWKEQ